MMTLMQSKSAVIALLLFVMAVWGGNFVAITFAVKDLGAFWGLFYRLVLVSAVVLPFVSLPKKIDWKWLFICAMLMIPLHTGFLFLALYATTSTGSISFILQSATPLAVIFAAIFYKDKPRIQQIIGIGVAFLGVLFLFYTPSMFDNILALLFGFISAVFMALYSVSVRHIHHTQGFALIGYNCFLGLPFVGAAAYWIEGTPPNPIHVLQWQAWIGLLYTVLFGSILGHGIWALLAKYQPMSFIAPFMLLTPVIATGFGAWFFEQYLTWDFVGVAALVSLGVLMVVVPHDRLKIRPKKINKN